MPSSARPVVGVIPAAGKATRLSPLPCSKELIPIGVHTQPESIRGRPKVVSEYLLQEMHAAGAQRVFIVLREGKFDIPAYFGDGSRLGLKLAYLMMGAPWGPPFSIAQAAPFAEHATMLLGFPDILVHPAGLFGRLIDRLDATGADLVLGVHRMTAGGYADRVLLDARGRVTRVRLKETAPPPRAGEIGCVQAAWGPRFTRFLLDETDRLGAWARSGVAGEAPDWSISSVFEAAVLAGLHVDSVMLEGARFLDIGTTAGYAAANSFPGIVQGGLDHLAPTCPSSEP